MFGSKKDRGYLLPTDPNEELSFNRKLLLSLLSVFAIVFIVNHVFFIEYEISGRSMEDTLHNGDIVKVNTLNKTPKHDDIIVFKHHSDVYIKRVVGLQGDKVEVTEGNVYVNGKEHSHEDSYLESDHKLEGYDNMRYFTTCMLSDSCEVPKDKYFVLGDNREKSKDSRHIGYVDSEDIIGTVYKSTKNKLK